jgi:response regulator RpfG family c-di-GMP phosphodiesterase
MKIRAKTFPFALAIAAQTSARSFRRFTHIRMRPVTLSLPRPSESFVLPQTNFAAAGSRTLEPLSIYAVDDATRLTELYTTLLEVAGYIVRTFNHRAKALAALKVDRKRPTLLITNYLGLSMPVEHFIEACRLIHPSLRILMASGYDQSEMRFSGVRPDRFIHKPFTPEEFQQAVKDSLAAQ